MVVLYVPNSCLEISHFTAAFGLEEGICADIGRVFLETCDVYITESACGLCLFILYSKFLKCYLPTHF